MSKVWNGSSLTCFSSQHLPNLTPCSLPRQYHSLSHLTFKHTHLALEVLTAPDTSQRLSLCVENAYNCGCNLMYTLKARDTRWVCSSIIPCLTVLGQKSLTGLEAHIFLARPVGLWTTGLLLSPPPLLGWQIDTTIANLLGVRDSHSSTHVCRATVHMAWATIPVHLCLSSYLETGSHTCEHRRMKWENTRKVLSTHTWRASCNSEFLIFYTLNLIISHFHQYLLHICLSQ